MPFLPPQVVVCLMTVRCSPWCVLRRAKTSRMLATAIPYELTHSVQELGVATLGSDTLRNSLFWKLHVKLCEFVSQAEPGKIRAVQVRKRESASTNAADFCVSLSGVIVAGTKAEGPEWMNR
jgi:hypothetical protein